MIFFDIDGTLLDYDTAEKMVSHISSKSIMIFSQETN